jgi:hypothetical protein
VRPAHPCAPPIPLVADESARLHLHGIVRILLGRANVREKFTLIEANELISCGVEANGEILALRAGVPTLRKLEARTAAIGRASESLERRLLALSEDKVRVVARKRARMPMPHAVRAALHDGVSEPEQINPSVERYRIKRKPAEAQAQA